jgi:dephospho-CoA kinase
MFKVGLTGGIGSGKSTVADLFNRLFNIPVIDADIIARQLVEPEQKALSLLEQKFGQSILKQDGTLDRIQMGKVVFSNAAKKKQLDDILHPLIYQQMQVECNNQTAEYCILCIPLLIENNRQNFVDRILVVDCSVEIQKRRVSHRDKHTPEHISAIISSQVSRKNRLLQADDIIDNSNSTNLLAEHVKKLHNHYLLLANV